MIDWHKLFMPDTPLLEIVVRGSCIYLALFLMLRLLKRQAGTMGISDVLVLVLIADAAQNGMAGSYQSITDGVLLVAVIMAWDLALDYLGYRFLCLRKFLHPSPLMLVQDGMIQRRNMRAEFITVEELMSALREQGVEDVTQVKMACMEGDGKISVVTVR